jgi:hypothetical protein
MEMELAQLAVVKPFACAAHEPSHGDSGKLAAVAAAAFAEVAYLGMALADQEAAFAAVVLHTAESDLVAYPETVSVVHRRDFAVVVLQTV